MSKKTDKVLMDNAIKLYSLDKSLSIKNVANKFTICASSLSREIERIGIVKNKITTTKHSEEYKISLCEYYKNNQVSFKYMEDIFKVCGAVIRQWCIKYNYDIRKKGKDLKFTNEKSLIFLQDYNSGISCDKIAKKYNISTKTVSEWLIRLGLKPKRYHERLGINDSIRKEAKRLYVEEKLNCTEISKILKVSNRSIFEWIKPFARTRGEIRCELYAKGKIKINGKNWVCGTLQTRFGEIKYDSSFERDRVLLADKDEKIKLFKRCNYYLTYDDVKKYNPDFYVEYKDGGKFVEEVKPVNMLKSDVVQRKAIAAINYFNKIGITYKFVTEKDIYGK